MEYSSPFYILIILSRFSVTIVSTCTDDLIAAWDLDGSEKDVILQGGASYKQDQNVSVLYLDGNRSYANVPSVSLYQFPSFSITFWVKVLLPAKYPGYIYADWSAPHQFKIWVESGGTGIGFQMRNQLGNDIAVTAFTSSTLHNAWKHVAVTWDQGSRFLKVYITGIVEARIKVGNSFLSLELRKNSHSFYQLGKNEDSGETFHGLIRKLKVFKKALSRDEIVTELAEFYLSGCTDTAIGVSNRDIIPDGHMTASSTEADPTRYQPWFGRLRGNRGDGWCAPLTKKDKNELEWLQVYLGDMFTVCRVDTQGDINGKKWVKTFKLSFSVDGSSWANYKSDDGIDVVFQRQGNHTTINKHLLTNPVQGRYIRFIPTGRHKVSCFRVEVFGNKCVVEKTLRQQDALEICCENGLKARLFPNFSIEKLMYHFNTWSVIKNELLTLDLLNSTSQQHKALKADVMNEFNGILSGSYGFVMSEFQRFGAQSPAIESNSVLLMADITIFCTTSAVKDQLLRKLRSRLELESNKNYLEVVDEAVNCSCLHQTINLNLNKALDQAKVNSPMDLMTFNAEVNHSVCSSSMNLKSYWHITKASLISRTFKYFNLSAIKTSQPLWSVRPNDLDSHYYYVSYIVRRLPDLKIIGYDYGYAAVLRKTPVARISGVSFASPADGNITLKGHLSYGTNVHNANPLNFTWFCRRSYEVFPESDPLPIVDVPGGNSSTSGGCYGYGPGRLSSIKEVLIVNVDRMEVANSYVFELVISYGVNTSRASHWFFLKAFYVSCLYNCGPKVLPSKRMIIESNCTEEFCQNITQHHWSLFKLYGADSKHSWVEVTNLTDRILTELDNPSIVLTGKLDGDRYSLEMNTTYKIKGTITVKGGRAEEDEITFQTVSPLSAPKRGCNVTPAEGSVLVTNFTVNCSGWLSEYANLTFSFGYVYWAGLVIVRSASHIYYSTTVLPQGNESSDYNITIKVEIMNQEGSRHEEIIFAKVKPLPLGIVNSSVVQRVIQNIEGFVKEGQVGEAATLAISCLSSSDNDSVKDAILRAMAGARALQISHVTQLSAIIILATEDRKKIPLGSLEDAVALQTTTITLLGNRTQDRDAVHEVGGNVLRGLSNTLNATSSVTDESYSLLIEQQKGPGITKRVRRMATRQSTVATRFFRARNLTRKTLSLVDSLGTALLSIRITGERKSNYSSKAIRMTLKRQTPAKLGKERFSGRGDEGGVTFPSTDILFGGQGTKLKSVDTQMLTLQVNPYVWSKSSKYIKSSVLSVDLKEQDGSKLKISNLNHSIELLIPDKDPDRAIENDTQGHLFVKPYNDTNAIRYHKVTISNNLESALIDIRPQKSVIFDVFVGVGAKPTPTNYSLKTSVPDVSLCKDFLPEIGYINCTSNPYVFSLSSNVTKNTGIHYIGIRLAHKANETNVAGEGHRVARSCKDSHGRQKRSCIGVKDPPTTPPPTPRIIAPTYDALTDVKYTMSVNMRSCLYWSEVKEVWTNEGCKVGQKGFKGHLQCWCTHLSAFGGDIFVAPNPIDFDKVFSEFSRLGETKNIIVLTAVCAIFGVYFVTLVFARWADRKDTKKVVANVFLSESQVEGYMYHVSIQTGMWKGFGTSSNVGIIINGNQGSSGEISLKDPFARRKYFSRGSVNNFTLSVTSSLGRLTDIRIWHDNSGSSPAWFLQQVVITDQQTEEVWYFFANQWLSLDERGGAIELNIQAAGKEEMTSFKPLFHARTARNLGEGHIWVSVFTRPPHSPFTRCQRLTCCLSFLLTAMITNAMFYQFDRETTDTFKFGPLVLSWTQIKIGIQSSVIAIPANLLVIFIFRNTKRKFSNEEFNHGKKTKDSKTPGFLPPFFVFVGWCVALLISLTGAAFTVFYSLQWGTEISNQWLTSILVSLVQDILVTQPIKVIVLASLLSLLIKKPPEHDHVIGPSLAINKESVACVSKPPQGKELSTNKDITRKHWKMREEIKEVASFLVFGFLLFVVCYGNQHPSRYQFTKSIRDIFAYKFHKVLNPNSLWNWVDEVLIPGLYDVTWYNSQRFKYEEGFINNKLTFLMGMPRLRQLRIKSKQDCRPDLLNTHLNDLFPGCLEAYSSDSEDRTPFNLPRWIPLKNVSHFSSVNDICPKPWRYHTAETINSLSREAVTETYDGGGYVADLGYNMASATKVVNDLRAHNWVDERTAAVFIEFTLFDVSSSLFCVVRNVYERLATGQVLTAVFVRVLPLYPSTNGNFQSFYEVCQLLFLVVIVVFFVAEIIKYFRQKRYLFQVWNWIQLLLLVASLMAVVMSILKGKHTNLYVKDIQTNPFDTFSSDSITRLLDMETFWLSMAIFVVTLKLLRIIRFNRHICQMQETLKRSAQPILSFSLVMVIAILAFSQFGFLCFGGALVTFSSFFKSLRVVLLMSVGKSLNNVEIHQLFPVLGPLFLFFFLLLILFVLINVFVAVLADSYAEVREEQGDNSLEDAALGTFMYNVVLKKIKLKLFSKKIPAVSSSESSNPSCEDSYVESLHDKSLDDIDYSIFEPSRAVKSVRFSSPVWQPLIHHPEYCNCNEVIDEAHINETAFNDKSSDLESWSLLTEDVTFPRCPQECFDVHSSWSGINGKNNSKEDDILISLKTLLIEIGSELSLISSSQRRMFKH